MIKSNKKKFILNLLVVVVISICCTQLQAQKSTSERLQKVDSIPLFSDIHYHSYFFSDKYTSDTILGVNYPELKLNAISKEGKFLGEITRKGSGLGLLETSTFIDVSTGDSGDIYVLRQDNAYSVFVYDYKGSFKKKVNLFSAEANYFSPIYYSNFKVIEESDKNQIRLFLSAGSTVNNRFTKKFYENNAGLLEFVLDDSYTILTSKEHLPYLERAEIQQALSEGSVSWNYPYPMFDYSDDKFYVIYSFSKYLYEYNKSFQLLRKVKIQSLPELRNSFSTRFTTRRNKFEEQRIIDLRLQYENVNPWNIQVKGRKALIQLFEPKESGRYPILSLEEVQRGEATFVNSIVIIKDLDSGQEKSYVLGKAYLGRARLINETEFLIQGMPDVNVEEIYLYKFRFN